MSPSRWGSSNRLLLIVGGVFSAPAIICFAIAGWLWLDTWRFVRGAIRTEAVVVDVAERSDEGRSAYSPVYEFVDGDGTRHRVASRTFASSRVVRIGERVTVLYEPRSPDGAVLDDFFTLWGQASVLCVLGAVLFLPGFALLLAGVFLRR